MRGFLGKRIEHLHDQRFDQCLEKAFLARKIIIDRLSRNVRGFGDLIDARAFESTSQEYVERARKDHVALPLSTLP